MYLSKVPKVPHSVQRKELMNFWFRALRSSYRSSRSAVCSRIAVEVRSGLAPAMGRVVLQKALV